MATQAGMILGTAVYMSPEQAKGSQADSRSDVFSFGSVLYEMLTGRQAFLGETAAEILASVLVREPDFGALPPNLNPRIPDLLRRCLEKNPKRRWQAVGDVRAELETIAADPRGARAAPAQPTAQPQPLWKRVIPVVATAIVVAALSTIVTLYFRPATPLTITRFLFILPEGQQFTSTARHVAAISPDGAQMVYLANNRLYLRSMSEIEARPISRPIVDSKHCRVFTRRPRGRIHFQRTRNRNGLRPAIPGRGREASDLLESRRRSPSPALVTRREGTLLRSPGRWIRGRQRQHAADFRIWESRGGTESLWGGYPIHAKDLQHYSRRQIRRRYRVRTDPTRSARHSANPGRPQLVRGTETARPRSVSRAARTHHRRH